MIKLKGKRTSLGESYDADVGCFTDNYMIQCKGGGTSTTTTEATPEQRAVLNQQLQYARQMEALGPQQFYGGDTTAGMTAETEAGLQAQMDAVSQLGGMSDAASQRFQESIAYDPFSDPATESYLTALTNPLMQQFQEETIPGLNTAAVQGGAFGGDRAAIQRERATEGLVSQMADIRAKGLQDIVQSNRENQLNMLRMLPQFQDAALLPSQVMQDVGAAREDYTQAEIDAERERFEFEQSAPRQALRDASSMLGGIDFGSVTKQTGGGK